jgi:iron complex transport system ATP-binding protein
MKEEIFIECKGVSIGYHERSSASAVVKSDLSIRAFGGEMVALIGENGIGKSTLLKTIAGFQPAISGELLIHQRSANDYPSEELARRMSFVSTGIVRVANLTVREMVGLGRFPYTGWFGQLSENDHRIIGEAIRQVGLSGYENRQVNRISDGERQKAMIARALAQDTGIIVLDEPTAFLDLSNKYEIVRILHTLANEQGKCILYSTHDLNTAIATADRIWLMLEDQVVDGIPEEVSYNGYFAKLFPNNPHLLFDPGKGDFQICKEIKGTVQLSATGSQLSLATKALERLGFDVITNLSVNQSFNRPVVQSANTGRERRVAPTLSHVSQTETGWVLNSADQILELKSLEELCRAAKKIRPQP